MKRNNILDLQSTYARIEDLRKAIKDECDVYSYYGLDIADDDDEAIAHWQNGTGRAPMAEVVQKEIINIDDDEMPYQVQVYVTAYYDDPGDSDYTYTVDVIDPYHD